MIFILAIIILIIICALRFVRVIKTKKSLAHIYAEIKYEIIYNIIGAKALLDDFIYKNKNVFDAPVITGKVAVVTGGARGIGFDVVKQLLKSNFQVIVGCRNVEAGNIAIKNIDSHGIAKGNAYVYKLDLASLHSIKSFAAEVKQNHPKIHLLVNNAGKMFGPYVETSDGYESQFGTNYLGHFLLTHLLLPEIKAAGTSDSKARIVNVSSCAHICGDIDFNDINQRGQYISSKSYAQSKLAQILFSNYLNSVLQKEAAPVAVYSLHPGLVNTDLFDNTFLKKLAPWVPHLFFKTPEQGATTIIFSCMSPTIENNGGSYINNCQIVPANKLAYSTILQEKLFEYTKKILGIREFGGVHNQHI